MRHGLVWFGLVDRKQRVLGENALSIDLEKEKEKLTDLNEGNAIEMKVVKLDLWVNGYWIGIGIG